MIDPEDPRLHFVVIGAQKAGTTSLFRYLAQHPDIAVPASKEAPYFSEDDLYGSVDASAYISSVFGKGLLSRRLGTVTPQYLLAAKVPERLERHNPDLRLIALLREPLERAFSEYSMNVRRGLERRSFSVALRDELSGAAGGRHNYLCGGLYGRALQPYAKCFPMDQLLAIESSDLLSHTGLQLTRVYHHLDVRDLHPPNMSQRYYQSGGREVLQPLRRCLADSPIGPAWRHLPLSFRARVGFLASQVRIKGPTLPRQTIEPGLFEEVGVVLEADRSDMAALGLEVGNGWRAQRAAEGWDDRHS